MPTVSSAKMPRGERVTATARPIRPAGGIGTRSQVSLVTGTAEPGNPVNAGLPEANEQSRRSNPTSPTSPVYQEEVANTPEIPQHNNLVLPEGVTLADVLGTIQNLSEEICRLKAEVQSLKENGEMAHIREELKGLKIKENSSQEAIEGLRSSLHDLEEVVFREINPNSSSPMQGTVAHQCDSEKKSKKSSIKKGVPSRQKKKKSPDSSDESSSDAGDSSDEEDLEASTTLGAAVPGLTEQVTRRPEFKSLVSYRAYRLADTSQKGGAAVSGKINSQLKRLRHYVDYKFSGEPAIQVLDFLKSFKEAADLNEVSEAAAAVLLPYFLDGRAKAGLSSRMKHLPSSMANYPAAVQWLLQSFATEAVIAASYQKVFTARQSGDEDEKQFATRLNKYAAEAGSVFSEDALISAFVDGLLPYASNTIRGQVTPTMTFAEVQLLAEQAGTAS